MLTLSDVKLLEWDTKTNITLNDWSEQVPNVTQLGSNNNDVNAINNGPFAGNFNIESIEIPAKIKVIGKSSFRASSLKTITFEENSQLTEILDDAFHLSQLTSIVIPNNVNFIGHNAFFNTSLLDITLPYDLFENSNQPSSTPQFGFTQNQWNSIKWLNYPKTGMINSIIARELLRENNDAIIWNNISEYDGIDSEAFKDTNITSLTIEWKENFTIEENTFLNTQSLTDIQMSNKFNFSEDDLLSFGFTLEQINKIKILNSTINIPIIIELASMIIISIGAILGILLFSRNKKNKQKKLMNMKILKKTTQPIYKITL